MSSILDVPSYSRSQVDRLSRRPAWRGMRPSSTRFGNASSSAGLSDGVATQATSRLREVAPFTLDDISVFYANYYGGESVAANGTLTIRASIEYPINTGVRYPVFFRGSRTLTLEPGSPVVASEPLGLHIAKGDSYDIWTHVLVTAGQKWPLTHTTRVAASEGVDTTGDRTSTGAVTASATPAYGPLGVAAGSVPSSARTVGVIGDSLAAGLQDDANYGYIVRGLGTDFGIVAVPRSGGTLANFVNFSSGSVDVGRKRLALISGCDIAIDEYGVNDLNGGASLATLQALKLQLATWLGNRGVKALWTTLTPWTTSTDAWVTTGNQTPTGWEATRVAFNDWVRAGAPIVNGTAVAVGTPNAKTFGQVGHPVSGFLEAADLAESARNSGRWKPNYTPDGIHANTTAATAMGACISRSLLDA